MDLKFKTRAEEYVENFDIDCRNYKASCDLVTSKHLNVRGLENNFIYSRDPQPSATISITFRETQNSRVFLGRNLAGQLEIIVRGDNSLIYIGDDCRLNDLEIRSFQPNDTIVVGNGVTTTKRNTWISGNGAGDAAPAIIIGDDCMFANDCVIRNSDGHPVFSLNDHNQVNCPKSSVILEPHVWIGERAVIQKDVMVGAGSIVALGSIVTKDIPRHSIAKGIPATSMTNPDLYWTRSHGKAHKSRALYFVNKYPLQN